MSTSRSRFIVVRHGETVWNVEGRYQGHLDSPLTAKGVSQSKAVGKRLSQIQFGALYSSDLGRARQTAELIAATTGHVVKLDSRLRERGLGIFQGLTKPEIVERFPQEFEAYRQGGPDHVIREGQSARQNAELVLGFFEECAERGRGEITVVVAHGGTLSALLRHVLGVPLEAPRRFRLGHAAMHLFCCDGERWFLETWGDTGHLSGDGLET